MSYYSKNDLLRIAHLEMSDSMYAVDAASLKGFSLGAGIHMADLKVWLKEQLGGDYPTSLPDNWLYACGI